ncbi:hypothetical protein ANCDUO_26697 [Ancylostoma duodenale]|uniref:Homeobox domain-containing protein n=1 Tax=Ancylostoma duodenale TaxID=51022 RepID=A0A0C2F439_9BILA|nr:hypothetical protein ANCDUO_26697 [Ancylostoma duodenale]
MAQSGRTECITWDDPPDWHRICSTTREREAEQKSVKTWFQNRRMKHKKVVRKDHNGADIPDEEEADWADITA